MKAGIAFALLFALCGIVTSQDYVEKITKIGTTCLIEANADTNELQNILAGKIPFEDATENMKCGVKCFLEKIGLTTAAGEFLPEEYKAKLERYLSADIVDRVIQACKDIQDDNPCDMAFKISNCLFQQKV